MKNEKEYLKLDTFSVLSNMGWTLTLLKIVNIIDTPWMEICTYWLALFGIALVLGITASILKAVVKGGNNSAQ